MAATETKPKAPEETHPPYPSHETLIAAEKWVRPAPDSGQLLFWSLDGPLESSIAIKASPNSSQSSTPYYNQTEGTWHTVSKLPLTEPKVSSITVHVYELEQWETTWGDIHWEHAEGMPNDDDLIWGKIVADGTTEVNGNSENMNKDLLRCCGINCPKGKDVSLTVTPAVAGEEGFVTVHDYVSEVHPWLLSLRKDILAAKGNSNGNDEPLGDDTELMVNSNGLESLMIPEKAECMGRCILFTRLR